jgi:hypothetical protein
MYGEAWTRPRCAAFPTPFVHGTPVGRRRWIAIVVGVVAPALMAGLALHRAQERRSDRDAAVAGRVVLRADVPGWTEHDRHAGGGGPLGMRVQRFEGPKATSRAAWARTPSTKHMVSEAAATSPAPGRTSSPRTPRSSPTPPRRRRPRRDRHRPLGRCCKSYVQTAARRELESGQTLREAQLDRLPLTAGDRALLYRATMVFGFGGVVVSVDHDLAVRRAGHIGVQLSLMAAQIQGAQRDSLLATTLDRARREQL